MNCRDNTINQGGSKCRISIHVPDSLKQTLTPITQTFHTNNTGSWTEEDELAMAVSRVLYFNFSSVSSESRPTIISSFAKTTPYTYSRTKGNDNGGGSGWSD